MTQRVYVLELRNSKYYVGKTVKDPQVRFDEHAQGNGAAWTRIHKPIQIINVIENADNFEEDRQTKIYMSEYGINNVRGGSYTSIILSDIQIRHLESYVHHMINVSSVNK
jgi:hypothetical protein